MVEEGFDWGGGRRCGKTMLLVIFQDGFYKDISSNQLTVLTVERSTEAGEADVPLISTIPVETVDL